MTTLDQLSCEKFKLLKKIAENQVQGFNLNSTQKSILGHLIIDSDEDWISEVKQKELAQHLKVRVETISKHLGLFEGKLLAKTGSNQDRKYDLKLLKEIGE